MPYGDYATFASTYVALFVALDAMFLTDARVLQEAGYCFT
jgi:hypothetical protein